MNTKTPTLQKLEDQTFIITLTITQKQIEEEYQKSLKKIQQSFKTKGFRTGKVPLDIIEDQLDQDKIIEDILSQLIPPLYVSQIKKHQLKPIISPQIKTLNPPLTLKKDWQIQITGCQLPQIKINPNYKSKIAKINKSSSDQKEPLIIDTLINNAKVSFPDILIQTETERQLVKLVDQIQQTGLTVSQYFQNKNTNLENYKKQLQEQIKKDWTVQLSLDQLARQEKITVPKEEIKKITSKNPNIDPQFANHLLLQQQVLNFLKKL